VDQVEEQYEELRRQPQYASATLARRPDGSALVSIQAFALPQGWNAAQTNVRFVVPVGFPVAKPDCFWTDPGLRLSSGATPTNTQLNANYGGPEQLLWFSFHVSAWDPNLDRLVTYANLIRGRFQSNR
jgi:hypothetical protein